MTEDQQIDYTLNLPNEVLLHLFSYLKPRQLSKCREVSWRWKVLAETILKSESMWQRHCQRDFAKIYKVAFYKRKPDLSWHNLYRSLYLWSKIQFATEIQDEFATATNDRNEIRDFQILRNGQIGIHTRAGIVYYDLKTLRPSSRHTISGDYLRYFENDNVIIILTLTADLHVIRKVLRTKYHVSDGWFRYVSNFLLHDDDLYYSTGNNYVYVCNLLKEKIQSDFLIHIEEGIMCLGYNNGYLNVLTYLRNIITVIDGSHVSRHTLDDSPNLFNELVRFNLLENLDWRVFFLWLFILNRTIPWDSVRDIIVTRIYGDVVFVGSSSGVFRIYYAPYYHGEYDIFHSEPVKEHNFTERLNGPVLTETPIIQIDVIEGEDSHTVLIGMPKKIAIFLFKHEVFSEKFDLSEIEMIEMDENFDANDFTDSKSSFLMPEVINQSEPET